MDSYWAAVVWSLLPTVVVLGLFAFVLRSILRMDRSERRAYARIEEEERAKRLQTIDADTAAEQARVEVLEKQYEEKLAKERAAEDAAGAATPPPAITPSHP